MRKRNFKVYAEIGVTPLLARKLSVVDTGAGPNFIRKDELPLGVDVIRHGPLPNVADANNNPIRMTGLVDLVVRSGSHISKAEFIVCERLAAPVIVGCDFCDRFVEAIYPRKKTIELDDGSTVPIVRRPLKRSPKSPPLPISQEYAKAEGRTSPKVRVAQNIILPPETQTWVSVKSERHGVMVLQPYDKLYADKGVIANQWRRPSPTSQDIPCGNCKLHEEATSLGQEPSRRYASSTPHGGCPKQYPPPRGVGTSGRTIR